MECELPRAAFVVSIDTEMSWGLNHRPELTYRYEHERRDLKHLLELFDRYDIPATWAIVGHLFLDSCETVDGTKHPEIVRPEYDWFDGDWFDADPCGTRYADPTWYATDLIDNIRSSPTAHEIGSHGFSHMIVGDPGCSRAAFDSEIRAAIAAADAKGIQLRSLIYPRNQIGHQDVLDEHGIVAYRGRRPPAGGTRRPWDRLVDMTLGSSRTTVRPLAEGDRWNLPATILFDVNQRGRLRRLWLRQVERRLNQAVANRSLFHLWFHPHDLRDDPATFLTSLAQICATASRLRDDGRLDTLTMGAVADQLDRVTT